jgi:hypothetical protein
VAYGFPHPGALPRVLRCRGVSRGWGGGSPTAPRENGDQCYGQGHRTTNVQMVMVHGVIVPMVPWFSSPVLAHYLRRPATFFLASAVLELPGQAFLRRYSWEFNREIPPGTKRPTAGSPMMSSFTRVIFPDSALPMGSVNNWAGGPTRAEGRFYERLACCSPGQAFQKSRTRLFSSLRASRRDFPLASAAPRRVCSPGR